MRNLLLNAKYMIMQTFKTELQKQREQRDMNIYLDFEQMRGVPGSSKTEVGRFLMGKYGLYSLGTIYAIHKRVAARLKAEGKV